MLIMNNWKSVYPLNDYQTTKKINNQEGTGNIFIDILNERMGGQYDS